MEKGLEALQGGCRRVLRRPLWPWEERPWFGLGWDSGDARKLLRKCGGEKLEVVWPSG